MLLTESRGLFLKTCGDDEARGFDPGLLGQALVFCKTLDIESLRPRESLRPKESCLPRFGAWKLSAGEMLSRVAVRLSTSWMEGRSFSLKTGTDMLENGDRSLYESAKSTAAVPRTNVLSVLVAFLGISVDLSDEVSGSVEFA